jgi:Icc-related predicted phosphoesterase
MVKVVCISDTHNQLDKVQVPDGDILIHAGDFTGRGRIEEITKFNHELSLLPHKRKIVIAGNHDILFETNPTLARSLLTGCDYLEDSGVEIEGIKFWGSPWQPQFYNWAFNKKRGMPLREKWNLIPSETDVLITHGPPYGVLDLAQRIYPLSDEHVGCEELRREVIDRIKPRLHVFGHIHHSYGTVKLGDTQFINAATLNEQYQVAHPPVIFNL